MEIALSVKRKHLINHVDQSKNQSGGSTVYAVQQDQQWPWGSIYTTTYHQSGSTKYRKYRSSTNHNKYRKVNKRMAHQ